MAPVARKPVPGNAVPLAWSSLCQAPSRPRGRGLLDWIGRDHPCSLTAHLTVAVRAFAKACALPSRVPSATHLASRAGLLAFVGCRLSTFLSSAHVLDVSGGPKPRCLVLMPRSRQPSSSTCQIIHGALACRCPDQQGITPLLALRLACHSTTSHLPCST